MTIVFVSNFFNIHQAPLCQAFYQCTGKKFVFIETTQMDADRVEMGFESAKPVYVQNILDHPELQEKYMDIIRQCDVAIIGSAPEKILKERLRTGKLTFKYSERYFKGGNTLLERIRFRISSYRHIRPLKQENLYFLCASAYTAQDVNRYEHFNGRCFKWGYFREVQAVSPNQLISGKQKNSILWVGRMIDWKHPELAVELAKRLKQADIPFVLQMVGAGEMINSIRQLIDANGLQDCIQLLGAKKPNEVRTLMDQSQIYIGTSDFKEGWGVVINEAMNSCCAVVASHAMGSAPFLIEDGMNGILFESGNKESLYKKVKELLIDDEKCRRIQLNAYCALQATWNAEVAAERFCLLSKELLAQLPVTKYSNGPCSDAEVLENDWYQG